MRVTVDGAHAYVYTGTKAFKPEQPTLLFIHGAANDHSVWALQSRYFAYHGWNALAPDLPGHGGSAGPVLDSIEGIVQWCERLLGTYGATSVAIVGHSMGSLAAIALAARLGQRCIHLALLGSAAPMAVSDVLLNAAKDAPEDAYKMIVQWSFAPVAQLGFNKAPGLWMTGQALALMRRCAPGVLYRDLLNCKEYADKAVAAAALVQGPVLVLSGKQDVMTPVKSVAPLIAALQANPRVKLTTTVLDPCGHSMMSEQPEEVLKALKALLAPA